MVIHGFQKLTLLDYPGKVACTLFSGGCNFRCPFCQNGNLVQHPEWEPVIPEEEIFAVLEKRRGVLDGVCVTGGEPTLDPDLERFVTKIKELGYLVKLDTNGYRPEILKKLVEEKNVDCYIVNTGDFMGKKVQPKDTLGILEAIVEKKAEFKQWGPFSDIEIFEWEGFVPDMNDTEYVTQLKARMNDRVNEIKAFSEKNEGYNKLPDDALAAIQKVVDELN